MKNYIYLGLILLSTTIQAQIYGSDIDISAGYVQDGIGVQGGYGFNVSEVDRFHLSGRAGFSSQTKQAVDIDFNIYTIQGLYLRRVVNSRRGGINVLLGGGVVAGYEDISIGSRSVEESVLINNESGFIFGISIAGEVDFSISTLSSIFIHINEQWHLNSDLGKFIPYIGLGYRYTLN